MPSLLRRVVFLILAYLISFEASGHSTNAANSIPKDEVKARQSISLPELMSLVLERNPELAVYSAEVRALAGRVVQAGLKPNPEFSAVVENFAGTGLVGLTNSAETTVQVSQRIEGGTKRRLRIKAAESEQELAAKELLSLQADLLAATAEAFVEVLADQERFLNRQELYELAQKTHFIVSTRVAAGKVSPIEESRSTVVLESARLEQEKTAKSLIAAKERLAGLWGGTASDFQEVSGSFQMISGEVFASGPNAIAKNLELKRAQYSVESRRSFLAFELAARRPDITVSGGIQRLNEYGGTAWVASVSVPLPFIDRRQGLIAEAQARIERAAAEVRDLETRLRSNLAQLRQSGEAALQEAGTLEKTILPAAKSAFNNLEEGYRQGKFDYLAVLDAQRTYSELKGRHIDAITLALKVSIGIQHLTGKIVEPGALTYMTDQKEGTHE